MTGPETGLCATFCALCRKAGVAASAAAFLFSLVAAQGETPLMTGAPSGKLLVGGVNRVMIMAPSGEVVWEYPAKLVHDAWMLPTGNILFGDGESVTEVTPDKKVVFQYKSPGGNSDSTYACQRLTNGNTLVGENFTGKILEVNPAGKVVFSLQVEPHKDGSHHNLRMVRKLDNGNYLTCQSGARLVREYTPAGKIVWESQQPSGVAFAALRTASGTTLVSSVDQIIEYGADGKAIWTCATKDLHEITARNFTGMNLLPNGNLIIGCYSAYQDGKGCGLLELTRDKKVVWSYSNPAGDGSMMAVQLLTAEGKMRAGPCLR